MPALLLLLGALVVNLIRHLRGKSTICSTSRPWIGPRTFLAGWAVFNGWFVPHYCNKRKHQAARRR